VLLDEVDQTLGIQASRLRISESVQIGSIDWAKGFAFVFNGFLVAMSEMEMMCGCGTYPSCAVSTTLSRKPAA
jgi:hypothetical protein